MLSYSYWKPTLQPPQKKMSFANMGETIRKLFVTEPPITQTSPHTELQNFILSQSITIDRSYDANQALKTKLEDLCKNEANLQLVSRLYHSMLTQQININLHL